MPPETPSRPSPRQRPISRLPPRPRTAPPPAPARVAISPAVLDRVAKAVRAHAAPQLLGRVVKVAGLLIEASLPGARIGDRIEVERAGGPLPGEVVALRDGHALAMALAEVRGLTAGARVRRCEGAAEVPVGDALLGRVVDVFGHPLDGGEAIYAPERAPLERIPRGPSRRAKIERPFETGLRVIDGLLPLGRGQRVGVFAGAGVGKTVLIRELIDRSECDVVVVGLIGERGVEVHDLLASPGRAQRVVVAATSDKSPLERARGAQAATTIAEHYADRGKNVLLVIDSLTRYAMALREIGLSAGELPATKGYPPSVFAALPRLLERVMPLASGGSITGVYTVLVEGDDLADPVADSARSLLDGHIVLSRELAARGHFPAVDVLQSASRVAQKVSRPEELHAAERARALLAVRRQVEELRSLGAYTPGVSKEHDEALELGRRLDDWSRQRIGERAARERSIGELQKIVGEKAS